jgi:hypothetical protein
MRLTQQQTLRASVAAIAMLFIHAGGCATAAADDGVDQSALARAYDFLSSRDIGKEILNYVHMGVDYHGHSWLRSTYVTNADGNRIPGQFALIYRFHWEDDGITDLAFLCNERGMVYEVHVAYTNAILNQPFFVANLSIQVLGNLLIESYKDSMTAEQLRLAHEFVDHADAKGLLQLDLKIEHGLRG